MSTDDETLNKFRALDAKVKDYQSIRFREGDVIELPGVTLEMATYNGCRELRVPKSVGAKVRKSNQPKE